MKAAIIPSLDGRVSVVLMAEIHSSSWDKVILVIDSCPVRAESGS